MNELQGQTSPPYTGPQIAYAIVRNATAQPFNAVSNAFETYADADYADYAIPMTQEGSSGYWVANAPSAITATATYSYTIFIQAGSSPSKASDALVGVGSFDIGSSSPPSSITFASPDDVLDGVDRGDGVLGDYIPVAASDVRKGVAFGPGGIFIGTLDTGSAPPSAGQTTAVTVTPTGGLHVVAFRVAAVVTVVNVGQMIYYTLDGSDPASSSTRMLYTGPVTFRASATMKAGGFGMTTTTIVLRQLSPN